MSSTIKLFGRKKQTKTPSKNQPNEKEKTTRTDDIDGTFAMMEFNRKREDEERFRYTHGQNIYFQKGYD